MTNYLSQTSLQPLQRRGTAALAGKHTNEIIRVAEQHGFNTPILGFAEPPREVVRIDNYLITPAHLDNTPLPQRPAWRQNCLYRAGLRPKQVLLVHEAPMLLAAPRVPPRPRIEVIREQVQMAHEKASRVADAVRPVARDAVKVVGAIAAVGFVVASAGALLATAALASAVVAVDPILIWVSDDNAFLEIDRWDME